jgi:hypothetical protein
MEKGGSALCLKGAQAFLRVGVGALRSKLAELNIQTSGFEEEGSMANVSFAGKAPVFEFTLSLRQLSALLR